MNKKERLQIISDLVTKYEMDTQEEIVSRLLAKGIQATQATVSRDIKSLGLVKVPSANGYVYALPQSSKRVSLPKNRYIESIDTQGQMLYIRVEPGTSSVVKRLLSEAVAEHIFSMIADDDSVLIVARDGVSMAELAHIIKEI